MNNTHLTVERLRVALTDVLDSLSDQVSAPLRLERLGAPKPVADATMKALVQTRQGRAIAVIICSPPIAPGIAARSARRADAVRSMLHERTASAIIQPIQEGLVDGLSYVMLPWHHPMARLRIHWIWQRRAMRGPVLDWLRRATAERARHSCFDHAHCSYEKELQHLQRQSFINGEFSSALDYFLQRLRDGTWLPRHTFDHNDLWHGNLLIRCQSSDRFRTNGTHSSVEPFVLIDWGAANPNGFGMYDLLRICRSLKVSANRLAIEVAHHCRILGSATEDAPGHLLAALGSLHAHREHFSQLRFINVLHTCWTQLHRALELKERCG